MITQRLTADHSTWTGTLTITTNPGDPNSYAELVSLREELRLRANVQTEGTLITQPPPDDPPVE